MISLADPVAMGVRLQGGTGGVGVVPVVPASEVVANLVWYGYATQQFAGIT